MTQTYDTDIYDTHYTNTHTARQLTKTMVCVHWTVYLNTWFWNFVLASLESAASIKLLSKSSHFLAMILNSLKHFSPRYIHDTQAKTCLAQHYANVVLRASKQTSVSWRYKMGAGLVQNGRGWSVTSQFKICQDFRSEWIPNWWRRLRLSGKSLTTTASNSQLRGKTPSIKERWKLFLPASSSILPSLVDRGEHFIISINPANLFYWHCVVHLCLHTMILALQRGSIKTSQSHHHYYY